MYTLDLSHNQMTELEPWPVIRVLHNNRKVDLRNNRITNFTNVMQWSFHCDSTTSYLLAMMNLSYNDIKHITDVLHGLSLIHI